jgi:hypothetical protein
MSTRRYVTVFLAAFLWTIVLLIVYIRSPLGPWLRTKSLVRQVTNNMDPAELQKWATNLLANHAGEYSFDDSYDTNVPAGLKKVKGFDRIMRVFPERHDWLSAERPKIWIFCGTKGGPFLVVGPPALATPSNQNIIPWKPGMYFVHDSFSEQWR